MDVTDEAAVARAFAETTLAFGGLDILVSNAGIAFSAPIEDTTLAAWDRNMDILAKGYFLVSREAFRLLKRQKAGGLTRRPTPPPTAPPRRPRSRPRAGSRCAGRDPRQRRHPDTVLHSRSGTKERRAPPLPAEARRPRALSLAEPPKLDVCRGRCRGRLFLRLRHGGEVDWQHHNVDAGNGSFTR
jgi:NAD(P)-dependent dehydrogenase (short-subunit alcohol dehydrogenase family)